MLPFGRAVGAAALGCALLLASGCGSTREPTTQPDQVRVMAAFYPLEYVAERVTGEHAVVTGLARPGAEPHDVELTPRQVAAIVDADAVVYLSGFQPAVDEAIAQSGNEHALDVRAIGPEVGGSEVGGPEVGGAHVGDHAGADPHIWLDPAIMVVITDAVADQVSGIDPGHAADYRANAALLAGDLDRLDAAYAAGLASCQRREFVTSHAAFGYLARRYHLTEIGIGGLNPDLEPSPARIAEVQRLAEAYGVTTVFTETLVSPAVAEAIAGDLGLRTDVLDPVETITADSRGDDYLAVMTSNLAALETANGCR